MKIKNLLLIAAAASLGMSAVAQDLQTYEEIDSKNGIPTKDHFFARNDYSDMGDNATYTDVVSFKGDNMQLVWVYLDDDAIYENAAVQGLTPSEYQAGKPYNEITYNSFQTVIYLPEGIEMTSYEDEDGNLFDWQKGDRMPNSAQFQYSKTGTTTIDGLSYNAYTLLCFNMSEYCTHFSSKTAKKYESDGALKKDSKLFGIYLENKMDEAKGRLDGDMIFAQTLLTLKETEDIYFYGAGGNGVENRKMYFHRVGLWGTADVIENLAEKTVNNVKYYNIAGMESNVPFDGVNIKVTTYNDGTTNTCKVIK